MKILVSFLFTLLLHANISAQGSWEIKTTKSEARALMTNGKYSQAAQIYKSILENDSSNIEIMYKYALCNHYLLNYQKASKWFAKVKALDNEHNYIQSSYYLGLSNKNTGNYQNAITNFEYFLNLSDNSSLTIKAAQPKGKFSRCRYGP